MEPGLGGQEKSRGGLRLGCLLPSRNGAWPWRPGKVAEHTRLAGKVSLVAMEPGLGGQEKGPWLRPRHRQVSGRNGAWPWRPGKVSRGGALQPGKHVAMEPGLGGQEKPCGVRHDTGDTPVAMEPGLGGQEKPG